MTRDGTIHIPFLVFGTIAVLGAGIVGDYGMAKTCTALAVIGCFMFGCNAVIFIQDNKQ